MSTDERKDLPPATSANFLEKVREAVQTYMGNRGDLLDRGLTVRDLADAGLIDISPNYFNSKGRTAPVAGPGPAIDGSYEKDLSPPPTPTGFIAAAGISNLFVQHDAPTYTAGHGHNRTILYGASWTSGPEPLFTDAVVLTEFTGTVFAYPTNPATNWHLWIKWESVDGVQSLNPAGGIHGLTVITGQDVALLLNALSGQISASQLDTSLTTRIGLIDADYTVPGSIAYQVLAEAAARTDAIAAEASTRTTAIGVETTARASAISTEIQDRIDGIAAEAAARASDISTEVSSRLALATQFRGNYTGTDLASVTSGLLYQESIVRSASDDALSQQITLLSAGAGEQFDYKNIWYFDTGVESWTGNGTPTATAGWIRPADHATDPYITSPAGMALDGNKYTQVRLRIRETGSPVWGGYLWWKSASDSTWDAARRVALTEPTYDGLGIGVIVNNPGWTVTVDSIRIDLSNDQSGSNYLAVDWVAIGRPSPGASSAQLLDEQIARAAADASEVTSRQTLSSKVLGVTDPTGATLAGLTNGVLYDERVSRSTADSSEVTARQLLSTKVLGTTDPSGATLASLSSGILFDERTARSTAISSEVSSRQTLETQLRGAYTGTDPAFLSTGLLYNERVARSTADDAMVSQITALSANLDDTQAALTTEELTRSNADTALASSITTLTSTVNSKDSAQTAALQSEATTRSNADIAEASARTTLAARVSNTEGNISTTAANLSTESTTRANADTALTNSISALSATVSGNNSTQSAAIAAEASTRANADTAEASARTTLEARVTTAEGNISTNAAGISSEATTRANADTAEASARTTLAARVTTAEGNITTNDSAITTEATTRANADTAEASARTTLASRVTNAESNIVTNTSAISTEAATRSTADSTMAGQITTLQSQSGTNSAAISTEATTRATQTGELYGRYTVKVDINGYVSGFGLASSGNGGAPSSQFIFKADQFAFGAPGKSTVYPFVIQASATTVNGTPVPAGVYINGAYIMGGSIEGASIRGGTIEKTKLVGDISFTDLQGGSLSASRWVGSPDYESSGGTTGWRLNANGTADLQNAVVRGTVYATAGVFTGTVYATSGSFTGAVYASSGSFSGSLSGSNITGVTGNFSGALSGADITGATGTFSGHLAAGTVDFTSSIGVTTIYTTPGTYTLTVPAGMTSMRLTLNGGGGGGGGGSARSGGAGSGGGASTMATAVFTVTPGATYTLTVGSGGAGGALCDYPYGVAYPAAGTETWVAGLLISWGGAAGGILNHTRPVMGSVWQGMANGFVTGDTGNDHGLDGAGVGGGAGAVWGTHAAGVAGTNGGGGGGGYGTTTTYSTDPNQPTTGGNGGNGKAVVEFYDPNGLVLKSAMDTLKTELRAQGHTLS